MSKNSLVTISVMCAIIGLAIGVFGSTLSYGQEAGILQQKVISHETLIVELKDAIKESNQFKIIILGKIGQIQKDVAVLTVIVGRIERDLDIKAQSSLLPQH